MKEYFPQLKKYLGRLRTWEVKIEPVKENELCIYVYDKWNEKYFYIRYEDSSIELDTYSSRPLNYYYHMSFEEDNATATRWGDFCDVIEDKWFRNEDDMIYRMKQLLSYYRPPKSVRKKKEI